MAKKHCKHTDIYASMKYAHSGEFPANPAWFAGDTGWYGYALLALLIALQLVGVACV